MGLKGAIRLAYGRLRLQRDRLPLEEIAARIRDGRHFSFVRFGDGEWSAILGDPGANCDGHMYFPELGQRLAGTLKAPRDMYYAMQPYALSRDARRIVRFIHRERIALRWHDADVFHDASCQGRLAPFVRALRGRPVVVVGPAHLRPLNEQVFPYEHFVEVPARNCFLDMDRIRRQVLDLGGARQGVVYLFSASMPAKVLVYDLFPDLGGQNWLLDVGSLWDVYVGVRSRGVFRKLDWGPLIARNIAR